MGHESIATTNRYLHHLGTGADLVGLERLNSTPGGTGGGIWRRPVGADTVKPRPTSRICAGLAGFPVGWS